MAALPHASQETDSAGSGWQGIRSQLFGQKRERDAEDGLLTVITQLQTKLATATGAVTGPLRTAAVRAQALRAVADGLNELIGWHREQLAAAGAIGAWHGPVPNLARDALAGVTAVRPLFEGAETVNGAVDARDLAQSVAQLRGPESDAFFNEALDGFVAMLEAVYARIAVDAPTASTAASLLETWDILVDELRALACPVEVVEEPAPEAMPIAPAPVTPVVVAPVPVAVAAPHVEAVAPAAELDLPAETGGAQHDAEPELDVALAPLPAPTPVPISIFPRFTRLELVAC